MCAAATGEEDADERPRKEKWAKEKVEWGTASVGGYSITGRLEGEFGAVREGTMACFHSAFLQ